jgi:hypothetical protein
MREQGVKCKPDTLAARHQRKDIKCHGAYNLCAANAEGKCRDDDCEKTRNDVEEKF